VFRGNAVLQCGAWAATQHTSTAAPALTIVHVVLILILIRPGCCCIDVLIVLLILKRSQLLLTSLAAARLALACSGARGVNGAGGCVTQQQQ
jgi:hypothetical protein